MARNLVQIIPSLFLSLISSFAASPQFQQSPTITHIRDGDTFEVSDGRVIRLIGVDTPEEGSCYSAESKKYLTEKLKGKKLKIETDVNELDQFGRVLAYVYINGKFLNEIMLKEGVGFYFHDYLNQKHQQELIKSANLGHDKNIGLYKACSPKGEGCMIKGNQDKNDVRRYVMPESRHYEQTIVNLDHGDRWFCTENDAIKAGFSKARM